MSEELYPGKVTREGPEKECCANDGAVHSKDLHEPVTSEQAKQIVDCLQSIKSRIGWLLYIGILIWFLTLMRAG